MKRLITILVAVLIAGFAIAAGDGRVTADGGFSLRGYSSAELLADGDATATLYDSGDNLVATYYLRDGVARRVTWSFAYSDVDSMYINLDTATETIYTLK